MSFVSAVYNIVGSKHIDKFAPYCYNVFGVGAK